MKILDYFRATMILVTNLRLNYFVLMEILFFSNFTKLYKIHSKSVSRYFYDVWNFLQGRFANGLYQTLDRGGRITYGVFEDQFRASSGILPAPVRVPEEGKWESRKGRKRTPRTHTETHRSYFRSGYFRYCHPNNYFRGGVLRLS